MRVVGGSARGRRLGAPAVPGLRPTSERVREAMFDILDSRGLVAGARLVDLFAGTGALGIEALSRGAAQVTFVERDARAIAAIERNLSSTGLSSPRARLARADALSWAAAHGHENIDVVLADPPYDFEGWEALFDRLGGASTVLVEHRTDLDALGPFDIQRGYRYGTTLLTLGFRTTLGPADATDKDPD